MSFAAVLGLAIQWVSGRPYASGSPPMIMAWMSASVLRGRLPLDAMNALSWRCAGTLIRMTSKIGYVGSVEVVDSWTPPPLVESVRARILRIHADDTTGQDCVWGDAPPHLYPH